MTAKKDLKKLVRERQAKTGERYVTALAQVRSQNKALVFDECRDVSEWALAEGFHCRAFVSEALWSAECSVGRPAERFRLVFSRVGAFLRSLEGETGADALSKTILEGEPWPHGVPNAIREITEARRFLSQIKAGVRGVSRNGRFVAFDVPRGNAVVTFVGICLAVPTRDPDRRPLFWLQTLDDREISLSKEIGAELARQLALAGLGGLASGDSQ
jgi:hypothetical protein